MIAAPGAGRWGLPAFDRIAFVYFHGFIGDFFGLEGLFQLLIFELLSMA